MNIRKEHNGIEIWFGKNDSKLISSYWYGKYWEKGIWGYHDNGAKKGTADRCFDCTMHLGYLSIGYTNWSLNQ